ncbi:type II toxin-antitoxin system RelE/ParE family toxin [Bradyrhizobium sp. 190]|uniref:type II toxin-antitoxin system RelE/ParE family toxin n=1 Tax=Bradyrhizobium sp. 190 TaxID=2782658 RepID=UPI001FF9BBBB|nr:type II toxin-antitoxin system RelE/ParE family toxin [Bradyrhizobium sp. 190]
MKVRYTRRALRQLAAILDYIDARSPQGDNVKQRLQAVISLLADHPNSGRLTNKGYIPPRCGAAISLCDFLPTGRDGNILGVRHAARRPL